MATNTFFERIVGGNSTVALVDPAISSHDAAALIALMASGEFGTYTGGAKQAMVAAFDLTHASDSATLDAIRGAYADAVAVSLGSLWLEIFEHRINLGRQKAQGLDGIHGYAIFATFIAGYDGNHDLRTTGISPPANRFTSWAPNAA